MHKKKILKLNFSNRFLTEASQSRFTGFHNGISGRHLWLTMVVAHHRRLSWACHLLPNRTGQWLSVEKRTPDFTGKTIRKTREYTLCSRQLLADSVFTRPQVHEYDRPYIRLSGVCYLFIILAYIYRVFATIQAVVSCSTGAKFGFHNNEIGLFVVPIYREGEWDTERQ